MKIGNTETGGVRGSLLELASGKASICGAIRSL